ncbi:MAG: hypothetical protein Q4F54_00235 [Coriobacteriia bacterium]|nr:hypothetical protein [Coriobacteriia bacterium]
MEVWQKSFKYVDKLGADALEEIAKHNTYFTSPYHSHGYEIGESEAFAPAIEACTTAIEADNPTSEADLASLEANYNIVLNAIDSYEKIHSNATLYNEVSP